MILSDKKVIILGCTGRLGTLIKSKIENTYKSNVIGVSRRIVEGLYHCDLVVYGDLKDLLTTHKPDLIINCAAMTDVDKCEIDIENAYNVNQKIPENIFEIITKYKLKAKVIHISTDQVYRSKSFSDIGDEGPINIYGKTKLGGDKFISKIQNSLIFRTNFLWANGQNNQINWLIGKSTSNKRFFLFKDIICNPINIEYLASFIIENALKDINGIFNLGSSDSLSKAEIFKFIGNKLNLDLTNAKEINCNEINLLASRPKIMSMKINRTESSFKLKLPNMNQTLESLLSDFK